VQKECRRKIQRSVETHSRADEREVRRTSRALENDLLSYYVNIIK